MVMAGTRRDSTRTLRGVEIQEGNPDQGQDTRPATSARNPELLAVIWGEYQNGRGGWKPAREFTQAERGWCKAVYSQRKPFWKCMERQIDRGDIKLTALNRIEGIYSPFGSITKMLIAIRRDKKRGSHILLNLVSVEHGRGRGNRGQ